MFTPWRCGQLAEITMMATTKFIRDKTHKLAMFLNFTLKGGEK